MDNQNIKQHFRPDEGPLIDELQDQLATSQSQYRPVLTAFMNPRQRYIARTLANGMDNVKMAEFGGYPGAEMQRILFYPDYFHPQASDFEIQALQVDYPTKFAELQHRQIMGTLLGEGLDRASFGDIVTDGEQIWQTLLTKQMAHYTRLNIDHVGKIKVKWLPIDFEQLVTPHDDWEELNTTVSSLRLDTIVAAGFNYSRNRAKQLIEHQLVQLNWEVMDRPDYPMVVHDILSVRHAGRIRIDQVGTITRKGKQRITLSVIHA